MAFSKPTAVRRLVLQVNPIIALAFQTGELLSFLKFFLEKYFYVIQRKAPHPGLYYELAPLSMFAKVKLLKFVEQIPLTLHS